MSSFYIVPGVYPREIDLSGRTAPISTTTGAAVFPSRRGPMEVYLETDAVHFEQIYGGSDFSWTFAHAMIKAFLKVANSIYLKRVTKNAKYAGSIVTNDISGVLGSNTVMFPFPSGRSDDYTVGGQDYQTIVFSGPIVAGSTVAITLNSDNGAVHTFSQVFNASSDNTLQLLAAAIDIALSTSPFLEVLTSGVTLNTGDCTLLVPDSTLSDARTLRLISPEGTQVTVSAISVSGGGTTVTATVHSNPWIFEIWAKNPGAYMDDYGYRILHVEQGVAQRVRLQFSDPLITNNTITYNMKLNGRYVKTNAIPFTTDQLTTATNFLNAIKTLLGPTSDGWVEDQAGYQITVVSPVDGPNTLSFDTLTVNGANQDNPTINAFTTLTGIASDDTFDIWIYNRANINQPVEKHRVSLFPQIDGNGRQLFIETEINSSANKSEIIRVRYNSLNGSAKLVGIPPQGTPIQYLSGGNDGILPSNVDIANAWEANFLSRRKVPCRIMINVGHSSPIVHQEIDSLCQRRYDCFGILDMPSDSQLALDAANYRNNILDINSSYTAIYTPDILVADSASDSPIYIPPSGHVAAKFAYSDNVAATWFAPAGLNRGLITQVLGLRHEYDDGQLELLISNNINPITKEYGAGYQIKSAETLQNKASALSNINVRRLLITIEVSLVQALNYSIYEPNTAYTRFLIVQLVTAFLQPIKENSGLYDYAVVCDDRNTTSYLIDEGQANVDIYLKPVLPIKYIQLTSVITKTGAYFQETIAAISGTA